MLELIHNLNKHKHMLAATALHSFSSQFILNIANRTLLRNTLFPINMVVAKDVFVGHANMELALFLLWAVVLYRGYLYWTYLTIFRIFLLTIVFRDIQQAIKNHRYPLKVLNLGSISVNLTQSINPPCWSLHEYTR